MTNTGSRRSLARPGAQKKIPVQEAKDRVVTLIQDGCKIDEAMRAVARTPETYRSWRKTDESFRAAVDSVRQAREDEQNTGRPAVPPFDEFCRDWLHQPLNLHQLRMWDVIEGREPRDLDPSMSYTAGYSDRVVINIPPHHGKSTTFTVNYVVWLIHNNPDIRIVIVSKASQLAEDFLYEIKQKLISPVYQDMHRRFAPQGSWRDTDESWKNDRIYVRGKNTGDVVQKDPTVQAMGLKGQIYGRRADLVILDDIADTKNSHETAFQLKLINRDIDSRLPPEQEGGGLLLVLGTRVAPMDIYRVLMDERDGDERVVWTYFRQPAVLDYGDGDSQTWRTLWPEKWSGPSLSRRRRDSGWNLIYQQLDIDDDMTFRAEAVNASVNGARFPGPLSKDGKWHRADGMDGLYVTGGLDPAATGNTAIIIAGLDPVTEKRWVIDGWNKKNATAGELIEKFKYFTEKYPLNEWVVEKNAFQRFFAQLPEIVEFCRRRGTKIHQHYTTANKFDSDWGIGTMAPLFDSCVEPDPHRKGEWRKTPTDQRLIELPSTKQNAWVNDLIQQLTTWQPEGMTRGQLSDLVMALWFTHISFDAIIRRRRPRRSHMDSPFLTPAGRKRQQVINLADLRAAKQQDLLRSG